MIDFSHVEQSVKELKAQFTAGQIDGKMFEKQLLDMVDQAADGYYWMFGHESERWYRYDGQRWLLDTPTASHLTPAAEPQTEQQSLEADWYTINIGWFITSLVVIGAIGVVVYASALI